MFKSIFERIWGLETCIWTMFHVFLGFCHHVYVFWAPFHVLSACLVLYTCIYVIFRVFFFVFTCSNTCIPDIMFCVVSNICWIIYSSNFFGDPSTFDDIMHRFRGQRVDVHPCLAYICLYSAYVTHFRVWKMCLHTRDVGDVLWKHIQIIVG